MTRPILFNTDMVRAILDGRKTQTRRVVKPELTTSAQDCFCNEEELAWNFVCDNGVEHRIESRKPPYVSGDVLYVRETWYSYAKASGENPVYIYKTHDRNRKILEDVGNVIIKWRPSIHMPRRAARIFLRVTDVHVERLWDITEDDVIDEGAEPLIQCPVEHRVWDESGALIGMCWNEDVCNGGCDFMDKSYGELFGEMVWDSFIKPEDRKRYGWAANPWVWVVSFERCDNPEW